MGGAAELALAEAVTPNTFEVLGAGRPLTPSSVMLTHGYWQRRFGGDASVIGRSLTLNSVPFTIGGVLLRGFRGMALGDKPDVFFPADRVKEVFIRNAGNPGYPGQRWLYIMGRLQPGVTIQQAQTELEPISRRAVENYYREIPAAMLQPLRKMVDAEQFGSSRLQRARNRNSGTVSVFHCSFCWAAPASCYSSRAPISQVWRWPGVWRGGASSESGSHSDAGVGGCCGRCWQRVL